MTDYTKLVEALRLCARWNMADDALANAEQAADAIEALQADMKTYGKTAFDEGYAMGFAAGEDRAEKQLPKRGKWVGVSPMVDTVQCSVCGGQLFSAELETPYCPYCGARMEVQE
jgi:hypothetical protein